MSIYRSRLAAEPLQASTGVTAEEFKAVFRHHPGGVAVITLRTPEGPLGLTATSVISVSAQPPLLAFSLAAASSSRPAIGTAESVVVNFLAEDQQDLAAQFARRGVDRFEGVEWCPLPTGEPVLRGTTAWVRGRIENRFPVGDSLLITVHADLTHRAAAPRPLVYVDRSYHQLSGAPRR